jgi:hypothetical protein
MTRYRKLVKKRNSRYKKYKTYRRNRHKAGTLRKKIKELLLPRTRIHHGTEKSKIKFIQHSPRYETATAEQSRLLPRPKQYFSTVNDDEPPPSYDNITEGPTIISEQSEAEARANEEQAQANAALNNEIMRALEEEEEEAEANVAANEGQRYALYYEYVM